MTATYKTGTAAVSNGSVNVVGTGTAWAVALVVGGMFSCNGLSVPIAAVVDDTHLTLDYAWPGTTGSGQSYSILRENSDAANIVDLTDKLSQLLVELSLAGIHPDNSGSLAKRNALTLNASNDNYLYLRAELGVAFAFYRWDGPSLAWVGPFPVASSTTTAAGVQSIVAGTGVTVDNTNPNIPVVSATRPGTAKATPVDADELSLFDSVASFVLKRLTWANLKATLRSTANIWSGVQTFSAIPVLSGGAISFPVTQIPSVDPNTLDDYEEGTWTPTLTFGTPGDLAVTYIQRTGRYTKIGRVVMLEVVIQTSSFTWTTATGVLSITGMPFPPAANVGGGAMDFGGITKAGYTQFVWNVIGATTTLRIVAVGSGAARLNVDATNTPSGTQVVIQGYLIYAV